jgi:hypothetical protein
MVRAYGAPTAAVTCWSPAAEKAVTVRWSPPHRGGERNALPCPFEVKTVERA